jgi:hypothetical protein
MLSNFIPNIVPFVRKANVDKFDGARENADNMAASCLMDK